MPRSKYGAKKVNLDGIVFDSIAESKYYKMLVLKKFKGEIKDFSLQPSFVLQKPFNKYGKKFLAIKYKADFKIINNDDSIIIVDVKGMATETAKIKRKLFDNCYPELTLIWVCESIKYGDKYGWAEYDELNKKRRTAKKKNVE